MKLSRLVVSLIGLAALAGAYYTGSLEFLAIAIVAFVAGLYLMGANKRPIQKKDQEEQNASDKSSKR
ncbi:MAG TPA: hypothetical protein VNE86_07165 [Nitrososphaerales archaeon]|nr:hypothetical protein [Nitrososphaerales archaeon]